MSQVIYPSISPPRNFLCMNLLHSYLAEMSLEKPHPAELKEPDPELDLEPLRDDSVDLCHWRWQH